MSSTDTPPRLQALAGAIADTAEAFILRHYGEQQKRLAQGIRKAIALAGEELPPKEKNQPAREHLADVAQSELLRRRGRRDLGVVTELGMALRAVTLED